MTKFDDLEEYHWRRSGRVHVLGFRIRDVVWARELDQPVHRFRRFFPRPWSRRSIDGTNLRRLPVSTFFRHNCDDDRIRSNGREVSEKARFLWIQNWLLIKFRCNFKAYCIFSLLNTAIYCIPAGWVWGEHGFLHNLGKTKIIKVISNDFLWFKRAFVENWIENFFSDITNFIVRYFPRNICCWSSRPDVLNYFIQFNGFKIWFPQESWISQEAGQSILLGVISLFITNLVASLNQLFNYSRSISFRVCGNVRPKIG